MTAISTQKHILIGPDGFAWGQSDSLIGCCRQLSRATGGKFSWVEIREQLNYTVDGVIQVSIPLLGEDDLQQFMVIDRDDVEDTI